LAIWVVVQLPISFFDPPNEIIGLMLGGGFALSMFGILGLILKAWEAREPFVYIFRDEALRLHTHLRPPRFRTATRTFEVLTKEGLEDVVGPVLRVPLDELNQGDNVFVEHTFESEPSGPGKHGWRVRFTDESRKWLSITNPQKDVGGRKTLSHLSPEQAIHFIMDFDSVTEILWRANTSLEQSAVPHKELEPLQARIRELEGLLRRKDEQILTEQTEVIDDHRAEFRDLQRLIIAIVRIIAVNSYLHDELGRRSYHARNCKDMLVAALSTLRSDAALAQTREAEITIRDEQPEWADTVAGLGRTDSMHEALTRFLHRTDPGLDDEAIEPLEEG
jgi:hypothetical protein